jgi:ABC-2 type transport system permease protein
MTTTLFWKPLPVATLTVRQFLGGKSVRVVAALAFLPSVFGLIYWFDRDVETMREFLIDIIFLGVVTPTLLPITVLILATGALGHEIEDRTLPYLTLKPLSRLRIVVEKFLGVVVVATPLVLAGLATTFLLVIQGHTGDHRRLLGAMLAAGAAGTVAYASIFLMVSLVIPRALLVGIIYSFVWESTLARFLPGVRVVSVRHYVQSIFVDLLDDPLVTMDDATTVRAALITIAAATALSLALATWRLRRMNLD